MYLAIVLGFTLVTSVLCVYTVNLTSPDTVSEPPSAWQTWTNPDCGELYYTTTSGASLTYHYVGDMYIYGFTNASAGNYAISIDKGKPIVMEFTESPKLLCGELYMVGGTEDAGPHTATITLLDTGNPTRLDILNITYIGDTTNTHDKDVRAIVGAVIGSIVGTILIFGLFFWFLRKYRIAARIRKNQPIYSYSIGLGPQSIPAAVPAATSVAKAPHES